MIYACKEKITEKQVRRKNEKICSCINRHGNTLFSFE